MKRLFVCCLVVAAGVACSPTGGTAVAASASQFPPYSDSDAVLFDDTFAPAVFGMALDATDDNKLAARARQAESVQRVRVSTVSSQGGTTAPDYTVVLSPLPPALSGPGDGAPIMVAVAANSPSYPLLRGADTSLVGKTFILLSKRYNEDGHIALHWRAEPDTDAVRAVIGKAHALHDLER